MPITRRHWLAALALSITLAACAPMPSTPAADPLPSWNAGPAKQRIVDFVRAVTTEGGKDYVAPADRIAVFDNDGTLWLEYPLYTQFKFVLDRIKMMSPQHPAMEDPGALQIGDRRRHQRSDGQRPEGPDRTAAGGTSRHHRAVRRPA